MNHNHGGSNDLRVSNQSIGVKHLKVCVARISGSDISSKAKLLRCRRIGVKRVLLKCPPSKELVLEGFVCTPAGHALA